MYHFRYREPIIKRTSNNNSNNKTRPLSSLFTGITLTPCPSSSSTSVSTSSSSSSTPPRLDLRHCVTRFTAYHLSTVISIVSTLANERPTDRPAQALIAAKPKNTVPTRCRPRYDRVPCFLCRFRCRHLAWHGATGVSKICKQSRQHLASNRSLVSSPFRSDTALEFALDFDEKI